MQFPGFFEGGAEVPEVLESAAGETIFLVDHSEYV